MESQRIAIIGTGAVGGYYGARLSQAGHDVYFHMRGDNLAEAKKNGLQILSPDGNVTISADTINANQSTTEIRSAAGGRAMDWVLVALKSTAMDIIPDLLAPLSDKNTRICLVMNGLVEDELIRLLNERAIEFHTMYGGMAFICAERIAPGRVQHTRYGSISFAIAHTSDESLDHEKSIEDLFANTAVQVSLEKHLLRGRWKKNMVNIAFNGLCVAMGGVTVDKIASDPMRRKLAEAVMDETASIGNADMVRVYGEGNFDLLGEKEKKAMMSWCDGVGKFAPSTMVDFIHGRPMEIRFLFREPLIRAARLGVDCPALESLVEQIEDIANAPKAVVQDTPQLYAVVSQTA